MSTGIRWRRLLTLSVAVLGSSVLPGWVSAGVIAGTLDAGPATVCQSNMIAVTMTVQNTSATVFVTNVTPAPLLAVEGTGSAMEMGPPMPTMVSSLPPGGQAIFSWNYSAQTPGTVRFTATVSGSDAGPVPVSTGPVTSGDVTIVDPANASLGVSAKGPAMVEVGQTFDVVMFVSDVGSTGIQGVTPSIFATPSPGLVLLKAGPIPSGSVSIDSGMSAMFTWTYSVTAVGTVTFTVSVDGMVCFNPIAGGAVRVVSLVSVSPVALASMAATLSLSAAQTEIGQEVDVIMSVRNTGDNTLENVTPSALAPSGFGVATLSGPTPSSVASLLPGATATFTWRAAGTAEGAIEWAGFATALDPVPMGGANVTSNSATTSSLTVRAPVRVPARIEAVADAAKGRISSLVDVTFSVRDSAGRPVLNVPVFIEVLAGGGIVIPLSGATDGNGNLRVRLKLGPHEGVNLVRASVRGGSNPTTIVRVDAEVPGIPTPYLSKNFFNPARGESVQVRLMVPVPMRATARVIDMSGELVRTVGDTHVPAGLTVWRWDGRNTQGEIVGNGMYFVQIVSGGTVQIKRVIVLKRG